MNRQFLLALIIFVVVLIVVLLFFVTNYNSSGEANTPKTDTINDSGFINDLDAISNDSNYEDLNSDIIKVE